MNIFLSNVAICLIRAYRFLLSPWIGNHCRFYPTCSVYAIEAIQQHGLVRGGGLTIKRLACCHPWHKGGVDLVPQGKRHG